MTIRAPHQRASWHDAFDAQMALWHWYRTPMGKLWLRDNMEANTNTLEHDSTRQLLLQHYSSERARLIDCDPIYVSAEMCEVIEAASQSFAPEPLLESDIITPRGFLYFERSFLVPNRFDHPTTIAGVSWNRLFSSNDPSTVDHVNERIRQWRGESLVELEEEMLEQDDDISPYGLALTIYCDTHAHIDHIGENETGRSIHELYPGTIPPLAPMHLTPWYFNMTFDGNEWDDLERPTGAEWWWRIVQTTFRLMQQKVSAKHRKTPERNTRKNAKRWGYKRDPEIVVVRLRREQGESSEPSGEEANYSHRFIVGGHWRNQPYRSENIYRQIWISPYVKGPKDKPLIIRPRRVFQWDR